MVEYHPYQGHWIFWHTCIDRIPSAIALSRRGISVSSNLCHGCLNGIDDTNHFLLCCHFAFDVLQWILTRYDIHTQQFSSVSWIITFTMDWGNCPKKWNILLPLYMVIYGAFGGPVMIKFSITFACWLISWYIILLASCLVVLNIGDIMRIVIRWFSALVLSIFYKLYFVFVFSPCFAW